MIEVCKLEKHVYSTTIRASLTDSSFCNLWTSSESSHNSYAFTPNSATFATRSAYLLKAVWALQLTACISSTGPQTRFSYLFLKAVALWPRLRSASLSQHRHFMSRPQHLQPLSTKYISQATRPYQPRLYSPHCQPEEHHYSDHGTNHRPDQQRQFYWGYSTIK